MEISALILVFKILIVLTHSLLVCEPNIKQSNLLAGMGVPITPNFRQVIAPLPLEVSCFGQHMASILQGHDLHSFG